jgi:transketolase
MQSIQLLKQKAAWVKRETLKIHKIAPGTRLASSLSCIEILTVLYYGKILKHDPKTVYAASSARPARSWATSPIAPYPDTRR